MVSPLAVRLFYGIETEQNLFSYIFPITFIAMYAANYKYLKTDGND